VPSICSKYCYPLCFRTPNLLIWCERRSIAGVIERDYEELKQELGLGRYEGRGGRGFHRSGLARYARGGIIPGRWPLSVKPSPEFYCGNSQVAALPFYNTVVLRCFLHLCLLVFGQELLDDFRVLKSIFEHGLFYVFLSDTNRR
jgi:hypothetical protein